MVNLRCMRTRKLRYESFQDPKDNIFYMYDRPEGFLKIVHYKDDYFSSKTEDLHLCKETKQYRDLRYLYQKVSYRSCNYTVLQLENEHRRLLYL